MTTTASATSAHTPAAATREAYAAALLKLARDGHDIVALDADLSASTGGAKLATEFPDRWLTVGAAEANMISIAAGLAATGKTVFAASFAVFLPGHCYDQIRVQIAQQRMNVKLVASHGGISVGEDGASAQAIEDLALMTALPGMNVVVPADVVEAEAALIAAAHDQNPWYIRVGRPKIPVVYTDGPRFQLGRADQLRDGRDVALIACGLLLELTLRAADALAADGISARVLNMSTLKPFDRDAVVRAACDCGAVVAVEEHNVIGGLGSEVARALALEHPAPLEQVGVADRFGESGPWQDLLERFDLTPDAVIDAARRAIARK